MFKEKHEHAKNRKNFDRKKSSMTVAEFRKRLKATGLDISKFARFSGIARTTISGWSDYEIPLYAQRALELYEINTKVQHFHGETTNVDEIAQSAKLRDDKSLRNGTRYKDSPQKKTP